MKTTLKKRGKKRGVAFAAAAVMALGLFGFLSYAGTGVAHAGEADRYTLTLHWSSLEGEDIAGQAPIVIGDIPAGTTVDEAMVANSMDLEDEHFKKAGYMDGSERNYRPMSQYSDWILAQATSVDREDRIDGDTHIYCYMAKPLGEASLTVKAPLCGTKTTTKNDDKGDPDFRTQTNRPQVTFPKNANYGPFNAGGISGALWGDLSATGVMPSQIIFRGGSEYPASFILMPKMGYVFTQDTKATLNGGSQARASDIGGAFLIIGKVRAEHSWDGGRVTKKATASAAGVRTYTCKGCHATKTSAIAKLPKKANTLTAGGKTVKIKYKKLKKKTQVVSRTKAITVSKPQGRVTYAKKEVTYAKAKSVKMSKKALKKYKKKAAKKIVIDPSTGKVTVKKGLKKGTYTVRATVTAAGSADYNKAVRTVTFRIKVR